MPNPDNLALKVSEISAFIRTDMARSTRLVILIKNIYTLRVTGIKTLQMYNMKINYNVSKFGSDFGVVTAIRYD